MHEEPLEALDGEVGDQGGHGDPGQPGDKQETQGDPGKPSPDPWKSPTDPDQVKPGHLDPVVNPTVR